MSTDTTTDDPGSVPSSRRAMRGNRTADQAKPASGKARPPKPSKPPKAPKAPKRVKKGDLGFDENGVPLKKAPTFVLYKGKKSKPATIARSLRALTMVLRVGQPEARALEIVGEQYRKFEIGRAYEHAAKAMREEGASFKQALMAEEILPRTVRELIEAAQTSQALQRNLDQAAVLMGEATSVKKKLLMNLIQPGFMMLMCIALLFVAVAFIIPGFVATFDDLDVETPQMTIIILAVAEYVKWGLVLVGLAAALFMSYWVTLGRKSDRFKSAMDTLAIRTPAIGPILQLSAASRLFSLLSANLSTGIGEPESLRSAANGCGNDALKQHCLAHAERMLTDGVELKGFVQTKLVPLDARQILSSAPSVRQEIEIMNELSPEYRDEASVQLDTLNKTIDPIVNYAVYGIAGVLIISIVLPMYAIYPALMQMG
ncbi:type II secretion system F family protein [Arthrobacter sp. IK3]|uniref:type II secretion system F family protein n=1 Tax=Arthrobacter sp. IK3 TaxID=3448169 RepID=UPI003EE0027D